MCRLWCLPELSTVRMCSARHWLASQDCTVIPFRPLSIFFSFFIKSFMASLLQVGLLDSGKWLDADSSASEKSWFQSFMFTGRFLSLSAVFVKKYSNFMGIAYLWMVWVLFERYSFRDNQNQPLFLQFHCFWPLASNWNFFSESLA